MKVVFVLTLMTLAARTALAGGSGGSSGGGPANSSSQGAGDSYWSDDGGSVVHLEVTDNPNGGTWTTATDDTGFSSARSGDQGADTKGGGATCHNSETMTTQGGEKYRIKGGKLQKRVGNKWVTLKKVKKPKRKQQNSVTHFSISAGQSAPFDGILYAPLRRAIMLMQGEAAPYSGDLRGTGEEVVSLPL